MTIADVVKILDGKLMAGDGTSPRAVGAVVANDLMSDVLLNDSDDILLLTSLASSRPSAQPTSWARWAWWCTTRSRSPRRC